MAYLISFKIAALTAVSVFACCHLFTGPEYLLFDYYKAFFVFLQGLLTNNFFNT